MKWQIPSNISAKLTFIIQKEAWWLNGSMPDCCPAVPGLNLASPQPTADCQSPGGLPPGMALGFGSPSHIWTGSENIKSPISVRFLKGWEGISRGSSRVVIPPQKEVYLLSISCNLMTWRGRSFNIWWQIVGYHSLSDYHQWPYVVDRWLAVVHRSFLISWPAVEHHSLSDDQLCDTIPHLITSCGISFLI